jgi:hypothetical protein
MIGTEVTFKIKESNPKDGYSELILKRGTIKDKVRMVNYRSISNVVDHYVIECENQYHFVECNLILFKQD